MAPLIIAIYISLTNWPLIGSYHFVGLLNYFNLFQDPTFVQSILYTLLYTVIVTLPILGGRLLPRRPGALEATRCDDPPHDLLPAVRRRALTTLSFMLVLEAQPSSGLVNVLLKLLHITDGTTAWLVNGPLATGLICVFVVWAVSGLTMVLVMSAMQGIPDEIYEAASLEGASWWQQERLITIPIIRNTLALSVIISVTGSLLAFTQFYILTQGGPGTETQTIVGYIYNRAFVQLQLGAATAEAFALIIVIGLVTAFQFWALREKDE